VKIKDVGLIDNSAINTEEMTIIKKTREKVMYHQVSFGPRSPLTDTTGYSIWQWSGQFIFPKVEDHRLQLWDLPLRRAPEVFFLLCLHELASYFSANMWDTLF